MEKNWLFRGRNIRGRVSDGNQVNHNNMSYHEALLCSNAWDNTARTRTSFFSAFKNLVVSVS